MNDDYSNDPLSPLDEDEESDALYEEVGELMNDYLNGRIPFNNLLYLMNIILKNEEMQRFCRAKLGVHRLNVKSDPDKYN